jgi:hypothetical protein
MGRCARGHRRIYRRKDVTGLGFAWGETEGYSRISRHLISQTLPELIKLITVISSKISRSRIGWR